MLEFNFLKSTEDKSENLLKFEKTFSSYLNDQQLPVKKYVYLIIRFFSDFNDIVPTLFNQFRKHG